jgi:hypothetical protein
MKKTVCLVLIGLFLLLGPQQAASGQGMADRLTQLTLDFWPDYDQPNVLILLTGTLPADTPLPTEILIPKPPGGSVHVVARITANGTMIDDVSYSDEGSALRLTLPERSFRVEYYAPYTVEGNERTFAYTWLSSLDVAQALAAVQQPVAAVGLTTQPTAVSVQGSSDGFIYHALPGQSITTGQPYNLSFRYTALTDQLSVENLPVPQGDGGGGTAVATTPESETNWLLIISGAAVVIAAIGLAWTIATQRAQAKNKGRKPQPRRPIEKKAPKDKAPEATSPARFCHECGIPLQPGDRFCRGCGTAVRSK